MAYVLRSQTEKNLTLYGRVTKIIYDGEYYWIGMNTTANPELAIASYSDGLFSVVDTKELGSNVNDIYYDGVYTHVAAGDIVRTYLRSGSSIGDPVSTLSLTGASAIGSDGTYLYVAAVYSSGGVNPYTLTFIKAYIYSDGSYYFKAEKRPFTESSGHNSGNARFLSLGSDVLYTGGFDSISYLMRVTCDGSTITLSPDPYESVGWNMSTWYYDGSRLHIGNDSATNSLVSYSYADGVFTKIGTATDAFRVGGINFDGTYYFVSGRDDVAMFSYDSDTGVYTLIDRIKNLNIYFYGALVIPPYNFAFGGSSVGIIYSYMMKLFGTVSSSKNIGFSPLSVSFTANV